MLPKPTVKFHYHSLQAKKASGLRGNFGAGLADPGVSLPGLDTSGGGSRQFFGLGEEALHTEESKAAHENSLRNANFSSSEAPGLGWLLNALKKPASDFSSAKP